MTSSAESLTPDAIHFLRTLPDPVATLRSKFSTIAACTVPKESVFHGDDNLKTHTTVDTPDTVLVSYGGATVRFQLLLGINDDVEPVGRVICSLQHRIRGMEELEYLGEFTYSPIGRTNFSPDRSGKLKFIEQAADLIVAHYLLKAHQLNATLPFR